MELLWAGLTAAIGLITRADPELRGIAGLSLGVSGVATTLAALLGIPLGVGLHLKRFRGADCRHLPEILRGNFGRDFVQQTKLIDQIQIG